MMLSVVNLLASAANLYCYCETHKPYCAAAALFCFGAFLMGIARDRRHL